VNFDARFHQLAELNHGDFGRGEFLIPAIDRTVFETRALCNHQGFEFFLCLSGLGSETENRERNESEQPKSSIHKNLLGDLVCRLLSDSACSA
jgi:hypothetical protein